MKTKLFTLILALVTSTGIINAANGTCGENLTWDLTNGVLTISGNGAMTDWTEFTKAPWYSYKNNIRSVAIGNSITSIGDWAFSECSKITSITIPSSVTNIGNDAFYGCSGLTNVEIPSSVTNIGNGAFCGCSGLTNVEIPNSVTSIGWGAFCDCTGMTTITIPNSVTTIRVSTFSGCIGLLSISIPSSVTTIGDFAYAYCSGLTNVEIPNSVTSIGTYAFSGCSALTSVTIGNNVTSIGSKAFENCSNITSVIWNAKNCNVWQFGSQVESFVFGDSVEVIPATLCSRMDKLTSIEIPANVTSIGDEAFEYCTNITSVIWNAKNCDAWKFGSQVESFVFGDSVEVIPASLCDHMNKLTSIEIPANVTSIGGSAFSHCSGLTSVTIGNNVTNIGNSAFRYCSGLTNVIIPNSVTDIGNSAFSDCFGLTSVTIGNNVTNIGNSAFRYCSRLTNVILNSNNIVTKAYTSDSNISSIFGTQVIEYILGDIITSIGDYAFSSCSGLTSVTIGNNVTSVGDYAFSSCSGLTNVTIPNSVTNIGNYAFSGCSGLTSVTIGNNVTRIGNFAFYDCSGLTNVTIPNSVTNIGNSAFEHCTGFTSFVIPNGVDSIGEAAFKDCSAMTSLSFGEGVKYIGYGTLMGCTTLSTIIWNAKNGPDINDNMLTLFYHSQVNVPYIFDIRSQITSFVFGDHVNSIPSRLCYRLYNLTSITIPNSVTSIGSYTFYNCSSLTNVEIPSSVTNIGNGAFYGCSGLTNVEIPNSVTSIRSHTFYNCSGLTNVNIPNSVASIGDYAFGYCSGLTNVIIPNSVASIGDYVFSSCSGLTSVTLGNSVASIGDYAFGYCSGLTSIRSLAITPPSVMQHTFHGVNTMIPVYVPQQSVSSYKAADVWYKFFITTEGSSPSTFYTISATPADSNMGTVSGSGTYEDGTQVKVTAVPKSGYKFTQWSDNSTMNPYTFIITKDTNLIAYFDLEEEPTNAQQLPYNEPFTSNIGQFTINNVNLGGLNYVWNWGGSSYGMKASAYVNSTNNTTESWLISPIVSLKYAKNIVMSFQHAVNKGAPTNLKVKISTDLGSTWKDLSIANWPAGTNWTFISTSLSLEEYANKFIQIAFVYVSTSAVCPTWEIKNFSITGDVEEPLIPSDIENVTSIENSSYKILRNGQVLILRGDKTYTLTGQEVK